MVRMRGAGDNGRNGANLGKFAASPILLAGGAQAMMVETGGWGNMAASAACDATAYLTRSETGFEHRQEARPDPLYKVLIGSDHKGPKQRMGHRAKLTKKKKKKKAGHLGPLWHFQWPVSG